MRSVMRTATLSIAAAALLMPRPVIAGEQSESNVVYGMYSGLALLMDVRVPDNPNGYGIVVIPGSGWHAPVSLDASSLKEGVDRSELGAARLLDSGYTLFAINHRAAPRFRYPAAVDDVQRAVRYIRHHADQFGIDPNHIGVLGQSSGGHLALMLGVLDGTGEQGLGPVYQESSKVQAVVALYPPTDFVTFLQGREGAIDAVASFTLTVPPALLSQSDSAEVELLREASPISHVSADDPPILLVHGDQDVVVPFSQGQLFLDEMNKQGVIGELIRMPGGGHGGTVANGPNPPDYVTSMVEWFDRHLRGLA